MHQPWKSFADKYGPLFDVSKAPRGQAYTTGHNLQMVCTLAKFVKPLRAVEIGTAYGHTAAAIAIACPDAKVDTFDVCRENAGETASPFDREILPRDRVGKVILEQSEEIRSRVRSHILTPVLHGQSLLEIATFRRIQFAFIDGDHTWRNVVADTRAVLDRISSDGVIVWDDYSTVREVGAFIDILNGRTGNRITAVKATRCCYIHLVEGQREALLDASRDL